MEFKRRITGIVFLFFPILFFAACEQPHVAVAKGNNQFRRGEFQESIVAYISVTDRGPYAPWIAYNLGNVFFALGEYESASLEWKKVPRVEGSSLLFKLNFNKGVLAYRTGNYKKAYSHFREALLMDPAGRDAKINLEYCLLKLNARNTEAAQQTAQPTRDDQSTREAEQILEYVKKVQSHRFQPAPSEEEERGEKDW